jgi:hypothetical protein
MWSELAEMSKMWAANLPAFNVAAPLTWRFSLMPNFSIIEVDDGLAAIEVEQGQRPEDAAVLHRGVLIDPGPYATLEEANDAIINLQAEEDEDERF